MSREEAARLSKVLLAVDGYLQLNMPQEALEELSELPEKCGLHPDILHFKLRVLLSLRRWESAFRISEQAIEIHPSRPDFYFMQACALDQSGHPLQAKEALLCTPTLFHDTDVFHLNLARLEAELGNRDKACRHIHRAMELNKDVRSYIQIDPTLRFYAKEFTPKGKGKPNAKK